MVALLRSPLNPALSLLAMKAQAGKVDFSKIIKMIDDMVVVLKDEAETDVASRDQCISDIDQKSPAYRWRRDL